jgi:hypothetical protein
MMRKLMTTSLLVAGTALAAGLRLMLEVGRTRDLVVARSVIGDGEAVRTSGALVLITGTRVVTARALPRLPLPGWPRVRLSEWLPRRPVVPPQVVYAPPPVVYPSGGYYYVP